MAKREPKVRDTKQRLLEAGLAVFSERGYRDASMDEIAARAGATKGALYYYFVDKEDLARDLARGLWERIAAEALSSFEGSADTVTNLHRGFEACLGALRNLPEARFFLRDCFAVPELANMDRQVWVPVLRATLEEGMARGELRALDADALAHVLVGAYAEGILHILTDGDPAPTVAVIRHLVGAFAATGSRSRAKEQPR